MNVNSDQFFHLTPDTTFETRLPWSQATDDGEWAEASTKGILRTRHPDLPEHSALVDASRRRSSTMREWSEDTFSFDAMAEVPEEELGVPEGFHVPYWNLRFDRSADPRDWGDPTKSDFHLTHQPLIPDRAPDTGLRERGSTVEFVNLPRGADTPRYRAPDAPWARRAGNAPEVPGPGGIRMPQFEDTFRRVHHVNPQQYAPSGTPDPEAFMDMIFPFLLPGQHDIDATLVNTHKDFLEDIQAVGEYFPRRGVDE